jgi:tyrosine-specific transport protein
VHKQLGATFLVAGTCIGSGMMALPMILANVGLIISIFLMGIIWLVMYYTALVSLELNLQSQQGLTLGELCKKYSGSFTQLIGSLSLKILSFSLVSVYIYGGTSIFQKLIFELFNKEISFIIIASIYSVILAVILTFSLELVEYVNRIFFLGLLILLGALLIGLCYGVDFTYIPWSSNKNLELKLILPLIPLLFTSFGFQVIFHTLTDYCNKNPKMLKRAFLLGSMIAFFVYIIWTIGVLSLIYTKAPDFYLKISQESVEVGELIEKLADISKWPIVQILCWMIAVFAILTSVIGVGLGLIDSISKKFSFYMTNNFSIRAFSALSAIIPAYLIAILIPNAFLKVFSFAGMILVIIAIILPCYLITKVDLEKQNFYPIVKNKLLRMVVVLFGLLVILSELYTFI